ncbi:hypothetical protein DSL64_02885 [Dyadobacter luteus]|uniref:Uncharacterized protein n=1 Tax=Dyadobacter luteus TaxID=2259619 RepID=A0A3D8YFC2_9BACT|nr:hypothetical protein DSL64_02885 [Dyadobacter luteus]
MTTVTQFEDAQVLRTALTYYLVSSLQSTVSSDDVIDSTGANFEFKIAGLNESLHCRFTHEEIAKVYTADDEFDLVCIKLTEELLKQYPNMKTQTVIRTFTMKK